MIERIRPLLKALHLTSPAAPEMDKPKECGATSHATDQETEMMNGPIDHGVTISSVHSSDHISI